MCSRVDAATEEHAPKTRQTHFSTSASVLHISLDGPVKSVGHANPGTISVLTPSVRNRQGIKFVMISATTMSASGTVGTAPSTGSSPGLTAPRLFLAGTSSRTGTARKSATILGVSLTASNARKQKRLANMTGTVLITMATASVTRVATLSRAAGTAWIVPLIHRPKCWMVF